MSFARLRLGVALAAFVGWLAWLAVAVSYKGTVQVVSRAQLLAATHVVVAEVTTADDGRPDAEVTITEVLRAPADDKPAGKVRVSGLPKAATPLPVAGDSRTPPAGTYLLPLVRAGDGYAVAGLPASPGLDARTPDRPVVYPWTDDVKAQLRAQGVIQ